MTESREMTLADAWTSEPMAIGDLTVTPPTTHRINVLMRRKNKWVAEFGRDQTDQEALVEWLFVLSRTKEELTKLFRTPLEEWEEILDSFLSELEEEQIKQFTEYFKTVSDSIEAAEVESDEPGKSQPTEAQSPDS